MNLALRRDLGLCGGRPRRSGLQQVDPEEDDKYEDNWIEFLTGNVAGEAALIDGLDVASIEEATRVGIRAACRGRGHGLIRISAGNYGGSLGPYHFHLRKILR